MKHNPMIGSSHPLGATLSSGGANFSLFIIYEMHVRGFTRHPSSGVAESKRGTYAGLIEKTPYLQGLGITAVEPKPARSWPFMLT